VWWIITTNANPNALRMSVLTDKKEEDEKGKFFHEFCFLDKATQCKNLCQSRFAVILEDI
jgi:hypothetical protein